jgi:hypothetical protein
MRRHLWSGLSDDTFSYQKSQLGFILEGLGMENVGVHILWTFGIFYDHLVDFMEIW